MLLFTFEVSLFLSRKRQVSRTASLPPAHPTDLVGRGVSWGGSHRNCLLHSGYDCVSGTIMSLMCAEIGADVIVRQRWWTRKVEISTLVIFFMHFCCDEVVENGAYIHNTRTTLVLIYFKAIIFFCSQRSVNKSELLLHAKVSSINILKRRYVHVNA